ncbi:MAG: nucleotide-binding protein [Candidatus Thiodiazotropha sp. (ex Lucinoma borealis)]|nr:nucleotide-binding protein [Candidatus Thiodiazotropha sp. (ex Lucinoma borealis)]MCU7867305.1 nucleotide-binding protein [Candidatus Thiodiazotropha sp. (ex Lucinoma borealis)]
MDNSQTALAKLAGVLKSVQTLLEQTKRGDARPIDNFSPDDVKPYFEMAYAQLGVLKESLPELYGDFPVLNVEPLTKMAEGADHPYRFGRNQLESLVRDIEQIFEVRANSELAAPVSSAPARVFISHGRANDWNEVQSFIEKDLDIPTLELAQEPNRGRTVLQKLEEESSNCSYAVIVMTGDDEDTEGNPRARENVMHEIGYFQCRYGLSAVCLLHEEGTSIPSNIHGLVYIPFPKGYVSATFGTLMRELNAFYG